MSALYTSLVRLKQTMNDGRLPPMTPIPGSSLDLIDPAFTIGYGAVAEDAERGLRCPIRGCGRYFHRLSMHIVRSHPTTSPDEVRRKLSIPQTARLVSTKEHALASARAIASLSAKHLVPDQTTLARGHVKSIRHRRAATATVGVRNLLNSCPAQLSHKLIDLHNEIRRTPTGREASSKYGAGFTTAVIAVFGTWSNAVAQCGLEARRKTCKYDVSDILEALRAYYAIHGALPSLVVARRRQSAPVIPSIGATLRAFGTTSWPETMRRAASLLNIHGGRYGLPERAGVA